MSVRLLQDGTGVRLLQDGTSRRLLQDLVPAGTVTVVEIVATGAVQAPVVYIDGLGPHLPYQFPARPLGRPAPFKPGRSF